MKTDKDFREKFCKKCSINAKIAHLQGKIPTKQLNSFESTEKKKDTYKKHKHQQGNKNSQFGTCWITNGIENKKIKKIDIDNWLCLDYYMGRV